MISQKWSFFCNTKDSAPLYFNPTLFMNLFVLLVRLTLRVKQRGFFYERSVEDGCSNKNNNINPHLNE